MLTAGLRANPVLFADAQLIPYQEYSSERPGGSTQYDVNITYPLDLNGKRRVRREVACRAKRVLEAQYQDAVRLQIDNLYTAYVDLLAARATVRFARESIAGLDRLRGVTQALRRAGEVTMAELSHVEVERDAAEIGALEAEQALQDARRALVPLLNLSDAQAMTIEPRGSIFDRAAPPPPADELIRIALAERPDLIAYRLGLHRAEANVRLARAERFSDIFVLVQPYTFQDNAPFDRKSRIRGPGRVSPLPIYDRNQGNIERARINVVQTRTELASLEQQVANEVRRAGRRYAVTRLAQLRIERILLPDARRGRDDALANYRSGEASVVEYLNAEGDYNDLVRQYRDTVIGHRRSMLALNTAVGRRVLP
ncbi:MAG: TolC family protein [Singulisphaera sp.]